ncbi:MAG TPA: enhanced serine sensitivity protein SseB C-terminal domain-containing protein [Bryobacteraceae bacterium]|nr:enhanced serine sensitivity protein SseB C-terminal domain-containing protein [Bryobacteraceae bacterium]
MYDDYSQRTEPAIIFLGEQDGKPERQLKSALGTRFKGMETVGRAYLVRVRYGSVGPAEIALALVASAEDKDAVVRSVHEEFRALFNTTQHLDIMFLTPAQEREAALICPPFFSR